MTSPQDSPWHSLRSARPPSPECLSSRRARYACRRARRDAGHRGRLRLGARRRSSCRMRATCTRPDGGERLCCSHPLRERSAASSCSAPRTAWPCAASRCRQRALRHAARRGPGRHRAGTPARNAQVSCDEAARTPFEHCLECSCPSCRSCSMNSSRPARRRRRPRRRSRRQPDRAPGGGPRPDPHQLGPSHYHSYREAQRSTTPPWTRCVALRRSRPRAGLRRHADQRAAARRPQRTACIPPAGPAHLRRHRGRPSRVVGYTNIAFLRTEPRHARH